MGLFWEYLLTRNLFILGMFWDIIGNVLGIWWE